MKRVFHRNVCSI